ncbi:MAG: hypothetical protein JO043_02260 [Candidatus Eremiobacteraeota bacterium]|nr:hypothetical protein [Candidatus Eremiobacteraeota bacterium]
MIRHRIAPLAWTTLLACLALAACSSSVGSGMNPMTPPVPQGTQYGIVPNNVPQSRQELGEHVALVEKGAHSVDVAQLGGFDFSIDLTKPTPTPTVAPAKSKTKSAMKPAATASPSPTPAPSPTATPANGSWKGKPTPTPTPSGPHIDAKVTIYPDGAQKPPGDSESPQSRRVPVIKVVIDPTVDVHLYSLAAFRFTIPQSEEEQDRGFTVALYETRKYHKDRFIDAQLDAKSQDGVVRAVGAKDAHTLSKDHLYTVILFGDALPQTPSPYSPPQYPGTTTYPQNPQNSQYPPNQQPYRPPLPGQNPWATPPPWMTPAPFVTPTPFHY